MAAASNVLSAAAYFLESASTIEANLYAAGSIARREFGLFTLVGGESDVDLVVSTTSPIGEYEPVMGLRAFLDSLGEPIQVSVVFVESSRVPTLQSSFAVDLGRPAASVVRNFDEQLPQHRLSRQDCFEVFVHQMGLYYTRAVSPNVRGRESLRGTSMHLRKAVFELARAALSTQIENPTYSHVISEVETLSPLLSQSVDHVFRSPRLDSTAVVRACAELALVSFVDPSTGKLPIYDDCPLCAYSFAVMHELSRAHGTPGLDPPTLAGASGFGTPVKPADTPITKRGPRVGWAEACGSTLASSRLLALRHDYFLIRHALMCGYDAEVCAGRAPLGRGAVDVFTA